MPRAAPPSSDEIAPFYLIEVHQMPRAGSAWQGIELAQISERVSQTFCSRSAGPRSVVGHERPTRCAALARR